MTLDTIVLPSGGRRTTVLGFGCSALVGGRTRAESLRLLDAAFDAGIRHYDVARAYGTGDAETILGEFARGRRDDITITTKFGIDPLPNTPSVTVAKKVIRPLMRRSRSLVRIARRHSGHAVRRGRFSSEQALTSVTTSLRHLETPIDVLLLHDCSAADWLEEDLRATLEGFVAGGQIGCYGTATSFAETRALLNAAETVPAVMQFDADATNENARHIAAQLNGSTPIVYGCLSRVLPSLRERVANDGVVADEWTRALGVDARSTDELAGLLISSMVRDNSTGIVLFSSGDPDRIARNVDAVAGNRFDDEQLGEFTRRLRALAVG